MKKLSLTLLLLTATAYAKKNTSNENNIEPTTKNGTGRLGKKDKKSKDEKDSEKIASISKVEGSKASLSAQQDAALTNNQQAQLKALHATVGLGSVTQTSQALDAIRNSEANEAKANFSLND